MHYTRFLSAIILCLLFAKPVLALDTIFIADEYDHVFGKGVHAFFDKNYEEAIAILSKAEELDIEDPRPFYFLGLAFLQQKEAEKAEKYFRKAAQLEFSGQVLRDYGVSEALRRIQGAERTRLEIIRAEERTNARMREQRIRAARYGTENAAARDALRQSLSGQQGPAPSDLDESDILADNAFGLRPIDPIAAKEGEITARRADANPFGTVTTNIAETPQLSETSVATPPSPVRSAAPGGRTFVNVDIAPTRQATGNRGDAINHLRNAQTEAARQAGRILGTFFSGQSD
ncbi:MAG: hypothetical protein FWG73_00795 [Planctomycetaceae bacterium]|nr:hypothetical protein [Planctomycetaceae bacterium]